MKTFQTYTGGHPFQLDDIKHVQASFVEFIEGCFIRMGSPAGQACILVGCEITGSIPLRYVSAGWVFFANQVLRVSASTITGTDAHVVITFATTVISPSPVVYSDASSNNCHQDIIGIVASTNDPSNPFAMYLQSSPRWGDVPWITPSLPSDFLAGPVAGTVAGPQFRKVIGSRVELQGSIKGNSSSPLSSTLFTLPVGFRPSRRMRFVVPGTVLSVVDVETNGDVNCSPVPPTGQDIYLDGIAFDGQ